MPESLTNFSSLLMKETDSPQENSKRSKVVQATDSTKAAFRCHRLTHASFILPIFISDAADKSAAYPIPALPGQFKFGSSAVVEYLRPMVHEFNLRSVILFGVVEEAMQGEKDESGSLADATEVSYGHQTYTNPVILAIQNIKREFGDKLLVIADICLCSYTANGHCGIMTAEGDRLVPDAEKSHQRLAQVAVAYAKHGADIVAPSDMILGRIGPMRRELDQNGFDRVEIMSYAIKYCSAFYGPFRSAVLSQSTDKAARTETVVSHAKFVEKDLSTITRTSMLPAFSQRSSVRYVDRSTYQLDPKTSCETIEAIANADVSQGASYLMVKPSTCYMDVLQRVGTAVAVPVGVYHTSGEYCQMYYAAEKGALDLAKALAELYTAFARSGASFVISYFTPFILSQIRDEAKA